MVTLIYGENKQNPKKLSNIKLVNKYKYRGVVICQAYISKKKKIIFQNISSEIETILYTIPNEEKEGQHYLTVKKLSGLLRIVTSKLGADYHYLNCFHSV